MLLPTDNNLRIIRWIIPGGSREPYEPGIPIGDHEPSAKGHVYPFELGRLPPQPFGKPVPSQRPQAREARRVWSCKQE